MLVCYLLNIKGPQRDSSVCVLAVIECLFALPLQAFLELSSEECAQTMVNYYSSGTAYIRNHPIYMQYSTHKELKTDNSPNQVVRDPIHTCIVKNSLLLGTIPPVVLTSF